MSNSNRTRSTTRGAGKNGAGLDAYMAAVREYSERGWPVVMLHPLHKAPSQEGWPALRHSVDDVRGWARHFGFDLPSNTPNLGCLMGEPSGGLVDVDCDCPEARAAAPYLMPPTGRVFGRASAPASHYLYTVTDGTPKTAKFAWASARGTDDTTEDTEEHRGGEREDETDDTTEDTKTTKIHEEGEDCNGVSLRDSVSSVPSVVKIPSREHAAMLVELRATGCQTVMPPSFHPSGERVRWEDGKDGKQGTPGRVTASELKRAVAKLAAAALLAKHWPAVGLRDEAAMALAGMLLRAGWAEDETDTFCEAVAVAARDEEAPRRRKASGTAKRLAAGETVWGATALAERLSGGVGDGERVLAQARQWLGMGMGMGNGRAPITPITSAVSSATTPSRAPKMADAPQSRLHSGPSAHTETHTNPMVLSGSDGLLCRVALADIVEEAVLWLWLGRIPGGALTLLDGDPGLGKTFVALDLAARVSTGREMPDGTLGVEGDVLLFTVEDNVANTIRPRLVAAGANLARIWDMREVRVQDTEGNPLEMAFTIPTHLTLLEHAIEQTAAKLVVIDPLTAYLAATVNVWNEHAVRDALKPLTALAQRTGAAILALRHLNKSSGTQAIYRGANSIGFTATARSNLFVAKDPDDPEHQRILTGGKGNLGAPPPGMRYCLQALEGQHSQRVRVEWLGTCDYSADMVLRRLSESSEETSAYEDAVAFLYERLSHGEQRARDLEREAGFAGISRSTFKRAKSAPRIGKRFEGFGANGYWVWSLLPEETPAVPPEAPPAMPEPIPDMTQETIRATEDHPRH